MAFADALLDAGKWQEFGPVGLQVAGADEVTRIACGVSSSLELFERAARTGAQLVLVHHGFLAQRAARGRPAAARKAGALFAADISLVAYHLALDAHPEVGNSAQLARRLGVEPDRAFGGSASGAASPHRFRSTSSQPRRDVVGREPLVFAEGHRRIERVAVSTGGARLRPDRRGPRGLRLLHHRRARGAEPARGPRAGIHLIAAGHYATGAAGRPGAGARIGEQFDLPWEFLEVENPV